MNPVILLDEVDKIGADWRGDPVGGAARGARSGAEPLVPRPLPRRRARPLARALHRDRQRRRHHPRSAPRPHGGDPLRRLHDRRRRWRSPAATCGRARSSATVSVRRRSRSTTHSCALVINDYTREAGVRQLERELGTLLRKIATEVASGTMQAPVAIDEPRRRATALGRAKFFQEAASRTAVPGRRDRLGGHRHRRRRAVRRGGRRWRARDGLSLTGQLGDVMKESARIALTWVRSHAEQLGIDPQAFRRREFHVHVPAGAMPKDGPSAGITLVTAIASLHDRPSGEAHRRHDRRGHAAGPRAADRRAQAEGAGRARRRASPTSSCPSATAAISTRCRRTCAAQMRFHPVASVDEVLKIALEPPIANAAAAA